VQPASILVLFAEDEPLVRIATQEVLETGGFEVVPAADGREAARLLDHHGSAIRALVTDIRLGNGPSGWDVARHGRQLNPNLPIVYVSGDSGVDWPVEGVPKSIFIQKPYAEAQVLAALATLLNEAG